VNSSTLATLLSCVMDILEQLSTLSNIHSDWRCTRAVICCYLSLTFMPTDRCAASPESLSRVGGLVNIIIILIVTIFLLPFLTYSDTLPDNYFRIQGSINIIIFWKACLFIITSDFISRYRPILQTGKSWNFEVHILEIWIIIFLLYGNKPIISFKN